MPHQMAAAHCVEDRPRTDDIRVSEDVSFSGLLLCDNVLEGLQAAGFHRPSPIQLRAIPIGRCGVDLIVQAKSGTGKTCVLAVLALELLGSSAPCSRSQALVLAPTREVAFQVARAVTAIGAKLPGLAVHTLIGGMPLAQDVANLRRCNVAVGTPGRVRQLVDSGALNTDSVRLFVMDEADKLMEDSFVEDINFIYSTLPSSKQMVALSATYPPRLAELLARYMRSPTFVRLGQSSAALLGVRQYAVRVESGPLVQVQLQRKLERLLQLLTHVPFTQCLVFSNHQSRAETLCTELEKRGWPSAHLSSALSQERRLQSLERLTSLKCRVLVTTDLAARGVDSPHADLVVHLDVPWDGATYLHRVGRAGRYGSLGAAVALVSPGEEEGRLRVVVEAAGVRLLRLEDLTVERDLKTCDVEGWTVFEVRREEDQFEDEANGSGDVNGAEMVVHKLQASGSKPGKESDSECAPRSVIGDSVKEKSSPGARAQEGSSEASLKVNSHGRKVRKAKRRTVPERPANVEEEVRRIDTERRWLAVEQSQLQLASDGWSEAVKPRGRDAPVLSEQGRTCTDRDAVHKDAKSVGDNSHSLPQNGSVGGDDAGEDSDDSFQAMLTAYKRDQQRRLESSGEEELSGTGRDSGQQPGLQQGRDLHLSGAGDGSSQKDRASKLTEKRGSQNSAKPICGAEAQSGYSADSSGRESKIGEMGAGADETETLRREAKEPKTAPTWDKDRLRSVLKKLNPTQANSLTDEELCALMGYLQVKHTSRSDFYQEARQTLGGKDPKELLARFGDSHNLEQIMQLLNSQRDMPKPGEHNTVFSCLSESLRYISSPSNITDTTKQENQHHQQKSYEPAHSRTEVAIKPSGTVPGKAASRGAPVYGSSNSGATYTGEEIRKVAYIPEEAAAFQHHIRQMAARERAARAAARAKARADIQLEDNESSGDDSSGDEDDEVDVQPLKTFSKRQQHLRNESFTANEKGNAVKGSKPAKQDTKAQASGCRPRIIRPSEAYVLQPDLHKSGVAPTPETGDFRDDGDWSSQQRTSRHPQQWRTPDAGADIHTPNWSYPTTCAAPSHQGFAPFWGGYISWPWYGNRWGCPGQYAGYMPDGYPCQTSPCPMYGAGDPHVSAEMWSAMLSRCYHQQTAYITGMSRFFADYYRERHE